jgi:hypothetical protein
MKKICQTSWTMIYLQFLTLMIMAMESKKCLLFWKYVCGTKGKYFNIYMLFIAYSNIMNLMFVSTKIYMLKLILNVRVFGREAFGGH